MKYFSNWYSSFCDQADDFPSKKSKPANDLYPTANRENRIYIKKSNLG